MNIHVARVRAIFALCGLAASCYASSVELESLVPELAEAGITAFQFIGTMASDEVLVVHSIRVENGGKVLELEDVVYSPDGRPRYRLAVIEQALLSPEYSDHWVIHEPGKQQHLQGVVRSRLDLGADAAELELRPLPGRARRHYSFRWEARVEKWADVRKRHPELPVLGAGGNWRHQELIFPILR